MTPDEFDLSRFIPDVTRVLDAHPVACMRLSLATRDEDTVLRAADSLREVTHARDIALVIDTHVALVPRLGLDGVHLPNGARAVRQARTDLGADAIVGSFCAASRHDGMTAGEAGADYVSFGPLTPGLLDTNGPVDDDIFAWWTEMIELPVVAEGGLDVDSVARLAPFVDFFAIGREIWQDESPAAALTTLTAPLR